MSLILISVISFSGLVLGKLLFRKWINHLTIYCVIMGGLIFLYELKLLPYPDIIPMAWFYIVSSFLCFLFGILTIIAGRILFTYNEKVVEKSIDDIPIFADGGKALKYSLIFFSCISLFVALHRWTILLGMFGSVQNVFLNAALVYRLNVHGEIKEFIPILPSFVYVAIFLSGIYTAHKGKFTLLTFLPFFAIILKELTYFGRGELLFTLLEFLFTFLLFRHLLNNDVQKRFKFSRKNAIIASTVLLLLIFSIASLVKVSRGSTENYGGTSKTLKELEGNFFISPSLYLYLSSDIGVFSRYLELEVEETKFGESTFKGFYFLLARLGIVEKPNFYQKGYFIPMWTNTGTYIRELHADFGPSGVFLVPYLLGFIITWLWFKFYQTKNLMVLSFLVYLFVLVGFSFLMMVTRLNQWYFSQVFILLFIPILEKLAIRGRVSSIPRSGEK